MKKTIKVSNISCAVCAQSITTYFETLGIDAKVLVNQKKVIFRSKEEYSDDFLIKELRKIGYYAVMTDESELKHRRYELIRIIITTIVALPLFILILNHFGKQILPDVFSSWQYQLPFATFLQFVIGYRFYKNAFFQLKNKKPGMDVLASIGTSIAYFYSIYLIFAGSDHFYFGTSGMLIWFLNLGEYLEHMSKGRTNDTLKELMSLNVKEVRVVREDGEAIVPLDDVKEGDIVRVLANEKIPLDGVVIEGGSYIDTSVITGESIPVYKETGDQVVGATANISGTLLIKTTAVGKDTVLSKIIETVEETALIKPKFQKLVDKIAGVFVFVVLFIGLAAFFIHYFAVKTPLDDSLEVMVAVFVGTCSCALALATPTSIAVASGEAFKRKILYKGGEFFELADKIDAIAFDKTGTLTKGKIKVVEVLGDKNSILYTKSLEKHSQHPIAKAILDYEKNIKEIDVDNFKEIGGFGIKGFVGGKEVYAGSLELARNLSAENPFEEKYHKYTEEGKIVILTIVESKVVNMFVLEDEVKDNTKEVIETLKNKGITPYLITGDNEKTAKHLAKTLGIEHVYANVLPHEKAEIIKTLQEKHEVVSFVGDGINDAPALKQADVGFSVANATEIASDTADVVLLEADLEIVLIAIDLSKKTTRNIKQNLTWALVYNVVMIPLAIFQVAAPLIAGIAHAFSSIFVVLNALRLKRYKYKKEIQTKLINVSDMTCGGCEKTIHEALSQAEIEHEISLEKGTVKVDPAKIKEAKKVIKKAGFKAR